MCSGAAGDALSTAAVCAVGAGVVALVGPGERASGGSVGAEGTGRTGDLVGALACCLAGRACGSVAWETAVVVFAVVHSRIAFVGAVLLPCEASAQGSVGARGASWLVVCVGACVGLLTWRAV